jgi:hypothetical protein
MGVPPISQTLAVGPRFRERTIYFDAVPRIRLSDPVSGGRDEAADVA